MFNADNAWFEIQALIILCEKKSTGFCGAGLDAVAEKHSLQWIPLPEKIGFNMVKIAKDRNVTVADVPLYSAFCHLIENFSTKVLTWCFGKTVPLDFFITAAVAHTAATILVVFATFMAVLFACV